MGDVGASITSATAVVNTDRTDGQNHLSEGILMILTVKTDQQIRENVPPQSSVW